MEDELKLSPVWANQHGVGLYSRKVNESCDGPERLSEKSEGRRN